MTRAAITFDFHDTLMHCPPWFELEVRSLVSSYLGWRSSRRGEEADAALGASADRRYRVLRKAIMLHGHELSAQRCISTILGSVGVDPDRGSIETGVAELMRAALNEATPVEGAIDTVRELAAQNVPLAVVSSAVYQPFLEWALERFEMREYFGAVVSSAACGFYKSRPEIYWEALRRVGAEPRRSVHIGDSFRFDVEGAEKAGLTPVWLNRNGAAPASHTKPALTLTGLGGSACTLLALLDRVSS
jgi:putative hydrolase of the HAD superfamily